MCLKLQESYIVVTAAALGPGISGIITAQGRTSPEDANGFIFKQCQIYGDGTTFLGRPWRAYARVLFYECSMTNIIEPAGWQPWNFVGHEYVSSFSNFLYFLSLLLFFDINFFYILFQGSY